MPTLVTAKIDQFVKADDLDVIRTINGVPLGQSLTDAWLTVDKVDRSAHLFQKHITTSAVPGQGQITDDGASDTIGAVRFELTSGVSGDMVKLVPGTQYPYDIQVKTSAGKIYTPETGLPPSGGITSTDEVTTETS